MMINAIDTKQGTWERWGAEGRFRTETKQGRKRALWFAKKIPELCGRCGTRIDSGTKPGPPRSPAAH